MRIRDLLENDDLGKFHKNIGSMVGQRVAARQAAIATQQAKNPNQWLWKPGDLVYSAHTGKIYTIAGIDYDVRNNRPMYLYTADNGDEQGSLIADLAHKSLLKINSSTDVAEAATAGATSAGNVATLGMNPALSPGKARGKKSYTGSPGVSGTKAPPQPKPKTQTPSDNALDIKGISVFGAPIKR